LLTSPLRARFGINSRLEYYTVELLSNIIERSAHILNVPIAPDATVEIARRSRGTPRIANGLLRRMRDFAQVKADGTISLEVARTGLEALHVDTYGLDQMDHRILTAIIDKFKGGPVGLTTIATAVGEQAGTIEEVYEPYLIQQGFIARTQRGRVVTEKAYQHLGRSYPQQPGGLFDH
jgi:Holliday junction DNA helicase RuvB